MSVLLGATSIAPVESNMRSLPLPLITMVPLHVLVVESEVLPFKLIVALFPYQLTLLVIVRSAGGKCSTYSCISITPEPVMATFTPKRMSSSSVMVPPCKTMVLLNSPSSSEIIWALLSLSVIAPVKLPLPNTLLPAPSISRPSGNVPLVKKIESVPLSTKENCARRPLVISNSAPGNTTSVSS